MMKRLCFILSLLAFQMLHVQDMWAQNNELPYLTFVTEKEETTFSVNNLKINVSGGKLLVTNNDSTKSFALTDLTKMYFSDSSTGISSLEISDSETIEVFTLEGMTVGTFANKASALAALQRGIYILKARNKSIKIAIK